MVRIQEREGNASSRLNPRLTYLSRPEQQLPEVPPNLHERLEALVSLVGTPPPRGAPDIPCFSLSILMSLLLPPLL